MNMVEKPLGFGANLPESYTLEKYVTAIGDQGDMGTCVGWSTTYYAATISYNVAAAEQGLPTLEQFNYDPIHTFENIKSSDDAGCQDGAYIEDALVHMMENGVKRYWIDPDNCGDKSTWFEEKMSVLDITSAWRIYSNWDSDEDKLTAVCQVLSYNRPVIIGFDVARSFFSVGSDGLFNPDDGEPGNYGGHAMCVVGYDDNKFGGCFKVVNSWGSSWGDDGYVYIKYEDFLEYCQMSYYFESELKTVNSIPDGCLYGNCNNGYGLIGIRGRGVFEGNFSAGKPVEGLYYNPTKKLGKGGRGWMKKMVKKGGSSSRLIYDGYDFKKPIGFVLVR